MGQEPQGFLESALFWVGRVSGWVWGPPLLVLLVGTGLYLTVLLHGLQFRELGHSLWLALVQRREEGAEGDISHFQALMTALAATVGTGNIAGVAGAIAAGGPGALFWMWVTGLVGMATRYAEALLAVRYRTRDANGRMAVGPYHVLFVAASFVGAWVLTLSAQQGFQLVWNFADVMNGMMAFPNLVGLLILSPVVARETREYLARRAELR